ncbi:hypothetical protein KIF59_23610 [Enterobacter cloacae subsp. cloacae]|nr:hypothetical protein [Enterobacter cloacae subsp. cloacae]
MNDLEHGWRFLSLCLSELRLLCLCESTRELALQRKTLCETLLMMKTSPENISLMILNKISIAMPDKMVTALGYE